VARKFLGRALVRYYLSLRMGAALAIPDVSSHDIPIPTPVVRQGPSRLLGEWDERELISADGRDLVLVRESTTEITADIVWN
jgi:hypothetical protein